MPRLMEDLIGGAVGLWGKDRLYFSLLLENVEQPRGHCAINGSIKLEMSGDQNYDLGNLATIVNKNHLNQSNGYCRV